MGDLSGIISQLDRFVRCADVTGSASVRRPAVRHRVSGCFRRNDWTASAHSGSLLSYGPDLSHIFRRAATYVDKILKGAKPADLPVEQPTKFELVINLKTAKALGLTIPQSVLIRADQIIE